jgi:hypothetical protein
LRQQAVVSREQNNQQDQDLLYQRLVFHLSV